MSVRLAWAWLALATGCASVSPAFDPHFPDNEQAQAARLKARLAEASAGAEEPALLVATTYGERPELLAYDLSAGKLRFKTPLRAEARPELHADLIVTTAQGRLIALDAASGTQRFDAELDGCGFLGAARVGERLFFTCRREATAKREAIGELHALDARSGSERFVREARGVIGRPLAAFGLLFVPWQRHSLAVIDPGSGAEIARLRIRDDVVDWALRDRGAVLFGQERVHALGAQSALESVLAGRLLIDTSKLPGRPSLSPSSFEAESGARSARGRVALYAEPETEAGAPRLAHDRFYTVFYRYVFAYDAAGALVWARTLPSDVISARAASAGLFAATERGELMLLSRADGGVATLAQLGLPLSAARFAGGTPPEVKAQLAGATELRRGLTEIALDADSRLVPARAYAVHQLAAMAEPTVTRDLLDIYAQSTTPPELKAEVADALRVRRSGLEHLIDALMARYDFLEQTRPAPLSVIVPALVEARETRALPLLLDRMVDPETPLPVLPVVVGAVAKLGDATAVEPLMAFLRLYRADSTFAKEPEALLAAARGVLALSGAEGPARIAEVAKGAAVSPEIAGRLAALLAPPKPAAAAPHVASAAPAPASPALPARLTQAAVNATFAEHIDDLRGCILDEFTRNAELAQVRVAFIAESDGSAHAFSFVPNSPEFVDCAYPKVAGYRFPRFSGNREVFRYVIALRTKEPAPAPERQGEGPWWQFYAVQAPQAVASTGGSPWWRSQQRVVPLASETQPGPPAAVAPQPAPAVQPAIPVPPAAPAQLSAPPVAPQQATTPAQTTTEPKPPEDVWWAPAAATKEKRR